jgi:hypothetical protein
MDAKREEAAMFRTHQLLVLFVPLLVSCSSDSALEPATVPERLEQLSAPGVAGSYELSFSFDGELTVTAHVEALASGEAAEGGAITFQYCSLKGVPRFDATQPDEAPSSACADGSGKWVTLGRVPIDPTTGDASLFFGTVQIVNIIGFRARYTSQNSGIASGEVIADWVR